MNQYMIAFSSYYKAAYAKDVLQKAGIRSRLGKTPPNLLKTCGYSIYMTSSDIRQVLRVLSNSFISYRAVYNADKTNGGYNYIPIAVR